MTTNKIPETVTVSRSITYSVSELRGQLMDSGDEMTLAEVLAMFVDWANEDLGNAGIGIKMLDDQGEEIPWMDILGWENV